MVPAVKLGIIGYGLATTQVIGPLVDGDRFEIVACADPDPISQGRFSERFSKPAFTSAEELFSGTDLDAVYIAVPTRLHEQLALMAFDHGVHVLVEKPIATTLEGAEKMLAASQRSGRVLMVNHKRSVDLNVIGMWQLTKMVGLAGCAQHIVGITAPGSTRARGEDERDPAVAGVVLRQGAHEFDILRLLLPSVPVRLRGVTGHWDDEREGEGSFHAWVECGDGTIVTVIHNGYDFFQTEEFNSGLLNPEEITVDRRRLAGMDSDPETEHLFKRQFGHPHPEGFTSGVYGFTLMSCDGGDLRPAPSGGLWLYDRNGRHGLKAEGIKGTQVIVDEFYRAIIEGMPPLHDGAWGLAVLELCLAVRASAETGDAVTLSRQGSMNTEIAQRVLGDRKMVEYGKSSRSEFTSSPIRPQTERCGSLAVRFSGVLIAFCRYHYPVSISRVPGGVVHQLPGDLRNALIANPAALDAWKDITPLARNEFICWVEDAKQEITRERRVRRTEEELEEGQRRPCCWPGCKHREHAGR